MFKSLIIKSSFHLSSNNDGKTDSLFNKGKESGLYSTVPIQIKPQRDLRVDEEISLCVSLQLIN